MSATHVELFSIPTQEDAFDLLKRILDGTVDAERIAIDFSSAKWASFNLNVTGERFQSTLNSDLMRALVEFQNTVYRVASFTRGGILKASAIDDRSREKLKLDFKVSEGSSEIFADAAKAVSELTSKVIDGMGPKSKLVIALSAILLIFGAPTVTSWIEAHYELQKETLASEDHARDLDVVNSAMKLVSQQSALDNARTLALAAQESKLVAEIATQAQNATAEIMRQAAPDADSVTFQGAALSGDAVRVLTGSKRRSGEDVVVSGTFKVDAADSTAPRGFTYRVRRLTDGIIIQATMMDAIMSSGDLAAVQTAFFRKSDVVLSIKARRIGNDYKNAEIISAELPPEIASVTP